MKNRFEVVGNELLIYVNSKKFGEQIIIADAEDLGKLAQYRWCVSWNNHTKTLYALTSFYKDDGRHTTLLIHRLITGATDPKVQVDHKNRNTLDNRKSNLQICSNRQNQQNQTKRVNNMAGYLGVHFNKNKGKFVAQIMNNEGKQLHLGYYQNAYSAALAYVAAKMVLHSNLVSWQLPACADGLLTIEAFVAHLEAVRENKAFQRHILSNYGDAEFASALSKIDFTTTKLFTDESLANYMERR